MENGFNMMALPLLGVLTIIGGFWAAFFSKNQEPRAVECTCTENRMRALWFRS